MMFMQEPVTSIVTFVSGVTAKAYVGVEYVVTPDTNVTIEVTGSGLHAGDDVYAGSCNEPCGVGTAAQVANYTPYMPVPEFLGKLGDPPMVIKRFGGFSFPA